MASGSSEVDKELQNSELLYPSKLIRFRLFCSGPGQAEMRSLLSRQLNTVRVHHPFRVFCEKEWESNIAVFLPDQ
jgi:hypothetical protein